MKKTFFFLLVCFSFTHIVHISTADNLVDHVIIKFRYFSQCIFSSKLQPLIILPPLDLQVKRAGSENKSEFYLEESKEANYMKIPSTDFQDGLSYRIVIHTIPAFVWVFALVT